MSNKPRILLFIDWYLPGYRAGGPTQSCANLISHLNNEFNFSVVTRDTDYRCKEKYPNIKSDEWNVLQDNTRVYYFSDQQLSKNRIYNILKTEEYDYIYLNGVFSRHFTLIPLQYLKSIKDIKIILATRGMLAESALAIKKWKKTFFLFFAKKLKLFEGITFHTTSANESVSVRKIFGDSVNVSIAPNFPERILNDTWKPRTKKNNPLKLVCVARIAPEKNIDYAIEVLKRVKAEAQLDLYGPIYNPNYWKECKKNIERLPLNITVNYMGSIESVKVTEIIAGYDFFFLPTRGENFGHAIVQAMSVGVPVIISDKTIWRHLENTSAGWDISLSDIDKFVRTIENCSKLSLQEYNNLSQGAFNFSRSIINNKDVVEQNRKLFLK